jgi:hypothetical protein
LEKRWFDTLSKMEGVQKIVQACKIICSCNFKTIHLFRKKEKKREETEFKLNDFTRQVNAEQKRGIK